MKHSGVLLDIPHASYQQAWDFQRIVVQERVKNLCSDTLLIVEHEPVFTMGRRTEDQHWKAKQKLIIEGGFGLYQIERGGSVTFHGPGQVVGYPILPLRQYCRGPKAYVSLLQDVIIRLLREWNILGCLQEKWPGVWVKGNKSSLQKIAAIGVRITKGVTMHGLALNANVDLKPFDLITPCGIEGCQVTSMEKLLKKKVDIQEVRRQLVHHFEEVFGLEWKERRSVLPDMTAFHI